MSYTDDTYPGAASEVEEEPESQAAAVEAEDELDDLDDMEFMLDEIENRIAPLA